MSSAALLLKTLAEKDIYLQLEGQNLRVNAPSGAITADLKQLIIQNKPDLLDYFEKKKYALTVGQERMWFISYMGASRAYNQITSLHIVGQLNIHWLETALEQLIQRHSILRTRFPNTGGEIRQVVEPAHQVTLKVVEKENFSAIDAWAKALASENVDLTAKAPVRFYLAKIDPQNHVLLLIIHHICGDGWSGKILLEDLIRLYSGETLPNCAQYVDFALWQSQRLESHMLQDQRAYWRQKLEALPKLHNLPTDKARPSVQSFRGETERFEFPRDLSDAVVQFSQVHQISPFMFCLTAFYILLSRYSGQSDVVVGSVFANRQVPEFESMVGYLANTLVLRADLSGNPSIKALLHQVKTMVLEALDHPDVPFESLVQELVQERDLSHNPIFQIVFSWQPQAASQTVGGTRFSPLNIAPQTAKFDLNLAMYQNETGLITGDLEYNTDLYGEGTIARMMSHYKNIVKAMLTQPECQINGFTYLSPDEVAVLESWNQTTVAYPEKSLVEAITEIAAKHPDQLALVDGDERLSYGELERLSSLLAQELEAIVAPETFIAICMNSALRRVVVMVAAQKLAAAFIPIDASYPENRLRTIVEDSQSALLVTESRLSYLFQGVNTPVYCFDVLPSGEAKFKARPIQSNSPSYLIYTSGSTGRPKGVVVPQRALQNFLNWFTTVFEIQPSDRTSHFISPSFDAAILETLPYLFVGASIHIPPLEARYNPQLLRDWLIDQRVSIIFVITAVGEELFKLDWSNTALRCLIVGGEKLNTSPSRLPFTVVNAYGPTENTVISTYYPIEGKAAKASNIPIGRPIPNCRVYVLDDYMQRVPIGVVGELHLAGDSVALAYHQRPEETAQAFIQSPYDTMPLYRTKDLVRFRPDGHLEFIGRADHQIKLRGFRIELGEIEAQLLEIAEIKKVRVKLWKSPSQENILVAYLVFAEGKTLTVGEISMQLSENLPDYMIPSTFVFLEDFPLTSSGKIDDKNLPSPEFMETLREYTAPRDAYELKLCEIWESLLKIQPIGVRDDFFKIGGSSLIAVRLINQINEAFQQTLPITILFDKSTIEDLALLLRRKQTSLTPQGIIPIQTLGKKHRLIVIPGIGGVPYYLRDLALALGEEFSFYTVQAPGLDGLDKALDSIPELADHYLALLKKADLLNEPFSLVGHSFGGYVAYEMAHRLQVSPQAPENVLIVDMPVISNAQQPADKFAWLGNFVKIMESIAGKSLNIDLAQLGQLSDDAQIETLQKELLRAKAVPQDTKSHQIYGMLEVMKKSDKALLTYQISSSYSGKLCLIRTQTVHESIGHQALDAHSLDWGWQSLCQNLVQVKMIAGTHMSIFARPEVFDLAKSIIQVLDNRP